MNTMSEEELFSNREIARTLVDELIGSVVLEQSGKDINTIIQQDLNESDHEEHEIEHDVKTEIGEFIAADGSSGRKFITDVDLNKLLQFRSNDIERRMLERSRDGQQCISNKTNTHNASYSGNSLESLEQHHKHVRFDKSCNTHEGLTFGNKKSNETIVYVPVPTSGYVKFVWFVTGVFAGVLGTVFISRRIK